MPAGCLEGRSCVQPVQSIPRCCGMDLEVFIFTYFGLIGKLQEPACLFSSFHGSILSPSLSVDVHTSGQACVCTFRTSSGHIAIDCPHWVTPSGAALLPLLLSLSWGHPSGWLWGFLASFHGPFFVSQYSKLQHQPFLQGVMAVVRRKVLRN